MGVLRGFEKFWLRVLKLLNLYTFVSFYYFRVLVACFLEPLASLGGLVLWAPPLLS
jgi:hypothetical protein